MTYSFVFFSSRPLLEWVGACVFVFFVYFLFAFVAVTFLLSECVLSGSVLSSSSLVAPDRVLLLFTAGVIFSFSPGSVFVP